MWAKVRVSTRPSTQISLTDQHIATYKLELMFFRLFKFSANETRNLKAIQNGSSRAWELANPRHQYVCIGGMGPIRLERNVKVSKLIDFKNKVSIKSSCINMKKKSQISKRKASHSQYTK